VQPGDLATFTAGEGQVRDTLGWSLLSSRPVGVHVVPGAHVTIGTEPHVRVLARCMRGALASARAGAAR